MHFPNLRKGFIYIYIYIHIALSDRLAWGNVGCGKKTWKKMFINVGLRILWREEGDAQFVHFGVLGKRAAVQM